MYNNMYNQQHPISTRFDRSGTQKSLDPKRIQEEHQLDLFDELDKYHEKYYRSAKLMRFAIGSNQDLDTLEGLAREAFEKLPNREADAPDFGAAKDVHGRRVEAITSQELGKEIRMVPINSQVKEFDLLFQVPSFENEPSVGVHGLLGYILAHQGENALQKKLRDEGLADWISYSQPSASITEQGISEFQILIGFTEKGLQNTDLIGEFVFSTLGAL